MTRAKIDLGILTCKQLLELLLRIADQSSRTIYVGDVRELPAEKYTAALRPTVFVSLVADIDDEALSYIKPFASLIEKYLLLSESGNVEAIPERITRLNIRKPERLHIATSRAHDSIESMLRRWVSVLSTGDEDDRILDAWWEEQGFVVMSHRFERLHLSLEELHGLRFLATATRAELEAYSVDESGAFLRWPELDVDLDWNGFLRLAGKTDPIRQRQLGNRARGYGAAIRRLRELRKLRQSDISGLDARHVRRIEKGELPMTYSALTKLSQSHGMSMQEYLDKLAELDSSR